MRVNSDSEEMIRASPTPGLRNSYDYGPPTESGLYSFTGLAADNYDVRVVAQAGWQASCPPPGTGKLTYLQVLKDGAGGVDGLYGAASSHLAP